MYLKITSFTLTLCLFFCSCSTDSSQSNEKTVSKNEIQRLDSLNQQIEENTFEIEESIQSVEAALSELDDFE